MPLSFNASEIVIILSTVYISLKVHGLYKTKAGRGWGGWISKKKKKKRSIHFLKMILILTMKMFIIQSLLTSSVKSQISYYSRPKVQGESEYFPSWNVTLVKARALNTSFTRVSPASVTITPWQRVRLSINAYWIR